MGTSSYVVRRLSRGDKQREVELLITWRTVKEDVKQGLGRLAQSEGGSSANGQGRSEQERRGSCSLPCPAWRVLGAHLPHPHTDPRDCATGKDWESMHCLRAMEQIYLFLFYGKKKTGQILKIFLKKL